MKQLREAFEAARTGRDTVARALAIAETRLAAHPGDLVARAYLGSLHAMQAGAAHLPWVKLKHATLASSLLDEAHRRWFEGAAPQCGDADYPGELEILLLRGVAYANFPAFLGKADAARTCLEQAERHPAFATIPASLQALAFAHLAVLHHRAGTENPARRYRERGMATDEATASPIWAAR